MNQNTDRLPSFLQAQGQNIIFRRTPVPQNIYRTLRNFNISRTTAAGHSYSNLKQKMLNISAPRLPLAQNCSKKIVSRDTFRQNSPKTARNQQTRRTPSLSAALNFSRTTILRPPRPRFPENLPLKPTATRQEISAARQGLSRNTFIPHTAQNRTLRYADKAFESHRLL